MLFSFFCLQTLSNRPICPISQVSPGPAAAHGDPVGAEPPHRRRRRHRRKADESDERRRRDGVKGRRKTTVSWTNRLYTNGFMARAGGGVVPCGPKHVRIALNCNINQKIFRVLQKRASLPYSHLTSSRSQPSRIRSFNGQHGYLVHLEWNVRAFCLTLLLSSGQLFRTWRGFVGGL